MKRKLFSLFLFVFAALSLQAQNREFIHINVGDYEVVDHIPVFSEQINLGVTTIEAFNVELIYPEYAPLTASEKKLLSEMQKKGKTHGGYELEKEYSTSRKERFLTVSFCPIVKRNDEWVRLTSCKLKITPSLLRTKSAPREQKAERWANSSKLSSGKWVKIRVRNEGIYELTPDFLAKMGFSELDKVKVYGYGGRIQDEHFDFSTPLESELSTATPDDLVEVPTLRRDAGLLFWAEGTTRWDYNSTSQHWKHVENYYSLYSYYFITEGDTPLRVQTLPLSDKSATVRESIPYAVRLEEDKAGWYEGGRRLFDSYNFEAGNARAFRLTLPDLALTDGYAETSVNLSFSAASVQTPTAVEVDVNGEQETRFTLGAINTIIESAKAQTINLSHRTSTEHLTFNFRTTRGNEARLDYIRVNYPRRLSVSATPYAFSPLGEGETTLRLANTNAHTKVWRLGQKGSLTAELPIVSEGATSLFTTDTPQRRFVAFDAQAQYPLPEFVEHVTQQNLHADTDIDYVIIVPSSGKLMKQAERLGELHRKRSGLKVKVVSAKQLYNEFSSGTPDANAYRRYLKMLYDRAETIEDAPKYLLLMGKSPWDNRFITSAWSNLSPDDYLLAYEVDASAQSIGTVNSYVTDDFYAMLDDDEGRSIRREKMDIAVGRLVCVTEEEARVLVDKVEQYMSNKNTGSWKNSIVLLGDDGDANEHAQDAEKISEVLINHGSNRFNIQKVYWDRYTRESGATGNTYPAVTERVKSLMRSGALMFNYSGHGAPHQISHEKSLQINDFKDTYSSNLALWVLASCEIYPFDSKEENLAENSLLLPGAGSIAFMCATRAVYASQNSAINQMFSQYVIGKDQHGRRITMGEALRLAKVHLVTPKTGRNTLYDPTMNKLKYVYFGDPALELSIPTGSVVLDSINGKALTSTSNVRLSAGSVVRFSGYVADDRSSEMVDKNFEGTIMAEIYDCAETITSKGNGGSPKMTYREQSRSVFKGSTTIKAGRFEFMVSIPRDISYSEESARISFYAVSNDRQKECNGFSDAFHLKGTALKEELDTIPPKVLIYLDHADTPDRAVVGASPTFVAEISDDSGINMAQTSLVHDMELIIDNDMTNIVKLNDHFVYDLGSYQSGKVIYPLSDLSLGEHVLNFRVWDINNNSTTRQLRFIVRDSGLPENDIVVTQNPAVYSTHFVTQITPDSERETHIKLEVYDLNGQTVWTSSSVVPPGSRQHVENWNLHDFRHNRLQDGVYLYRAVISTEKGKQETPTHKLIISQK
ncbi:type IX secretion system sortase PorU [Alloprevotella sp. OH1205_COT-284]|uniref:type IX secretion system sortase PorU n=1 Tax=Alloprevotella sp. OH1205_COT-284 TaxID=2491043 RepID=UPI000F5F64C0|nr:type IX secretion system sortase PorU [Alloprevotella sp. OH1205_COT-284]RRD80440.1 type IX secretion system sortase PorU [Alloprevotella sp. OH1205_COT-284]